MSADTPLPHPVAAPTADAPPATPGRASRGKGSATRARTSTG